MSKISLKVATGVAILGGIVASAVSASAALNLAPQSCAYKFNTNMKLNSRGTDVMNLQKVLNMYPQTQVAATGAGSPGMETTKFGPATRAAVNKFQALHLVELGITAPTGNVFAGTRALLNEVCSGSVSTNTGNTGNTTGNTGTVVSGPVTAMLASSQPTGMIVQGQSGALLANLSFSGNGTVTSVQLQRTGVSADTTLSNVYLYDGNTRITDAASVVTGGYINFNAPNGLFSVNGSRTISVRADIAGSTSGQSVGVKLNSVTAGGAASTYTNVWGNALQIASVTTSAVQFSSTALGSNANTSGLSSGGVQVDPGTTGYNVWEGVATVSTRDVNFRAATFKFVGSAPVDALANISLFVDGTKVAGPTTINAANNNKITFDLGTTPYLLKTGSHTIQVRADVVKGSNRTVSISVENVSDLMFEDSNLTGVNVSATIGNSTTILTQGNSVYNTIGIKKGSVTVNVDPAFVANKVTGGATNVPVGQFTMKAYGEDIKVNTLQVDFTTVTATTSNNVSLYLNGGQVGTSQNYRGTALSYNLGSSLIIPAGQTVTLTVKADMVNNDSAAWTTGTIATKLGGVQNNAQGQSSNELVSVAYPLSTSNTLTVSSGAGTFARTAGFTAVTTAPNTPNVKIGSFTLQANSSEDIKVNSIGVNPNAMVSGASTPTNISNLTVKDGSTVLGTPVGNPSAGTTTFSFADITVPANQTKTFDVYADIGGGASASTTAAMSLSYRGSVSNTTSSSDAAGATVTSAASTLASSTLVSSSPTGQFVVGGSTFGIATYKLSTASAGTQANVRELRFTTTGTDAITSITVGGVTSPVVSGAATVSGLNIAISSSGTDVPVTVKYAGFQNSTTGGSLQASIPTTKVTLTYIEATAGSGSVITDSPSVNSNTMYLVASKPTVSVSAGNTDTLILGAENKVGEFTVTADANGKIAIASTSLSVSAVGVASGYEITAARIADGNTTISSAVTTGSSTIVSTFATPYEIGAGQSKTFSVFATVTGSAQSGITPYVASTLTSAATFKWVDVLGGTSVITGSNIYNFPTSSFTSKR